MGALPPETPALLEAEWVAFQKRHPEMTPEQARREFDIVQVMSREHYDARVAKWAERRALANAWVRVRIEEQFSPDTVPEDFIQAAVDSYAFNSGHPALVTASHLLIQPDVASSPDERRQALEVARQAIVAANDYSDEGLRKQAQRLERAGFRVDMNDNLTFPRRPIPPFMFSESNYPAVVEPFAAAAFQLSNDNPLSPVVESEFGFHIILFKSKTDEKKASPVDDRDFIVSHIVAQGRKNGTTMFLDKLMQNADMRINEKRLGEITEIR